MTDRELLEFIASQVGNLTINMDTIITNIDIFTKDVSELKEGQIRIENKLDELEGKNATNHVSTNNRLDKVSDDLDFLTHKEFQTEKEMFQIKQKLNNQKRISR